MTFNGDDDVLETKIEDMESQNHSESIVGSLPLADEDMRFGPAGHDQHQQGGPSKSKLLGHDGSSSNPQEPIDIAEMWQRVPARPQAVALRSCLGPLSLLRRFRPAVRCSPMRRPMTSTPMRMSESRHIEQSFSRRRRREVREVLREEGRGSDGGAHRAYISQSSRLVGCQGSRMARR